MAKKQVDTRNMAGYREIEIPEGDIVGLKTLTRVIFSEHFEIRQWCWVPEEKKLLVLLRRT